jgi:hypothetical protein
MDNVGDPDGGEGGRQRGRMVSAQQPASAGEADRYASEVGATSQPLRVGEFAS